MKFVTIAAIIACASAAEPTEQEQHANFDARLEEILQENELKDSFEARFDEILIENEELENVGSALDEVLGEIMGPNAALDEVMDEVTEPATLEDALGEAMEFIDMQEKVTALVDHTQTMLAAVGEALEPVTPDETEFMDALPGILADFCGAEGCQKAASADHTELLSAVDEALELDIMQPDVEKIVAATQAMVAEIAELLPAQPEEDAAELFAALP